MRWQKTIHTRLSRAYLALARLSCRMFRKLLFETNNEKFSHRGVKSKKICRAVWSIDVNKNAQLSLTNPRDAKACQKLLQFDVLTKTLSQTILAYLHSFSCCCVRNLCNPAKITENSNLWSSRSSKVIDLGVNRKPMYDFLLVTNSNFGRICYLFRDIDA